MDQAPPQGTLNITVNAAGVVGYTEHSARKVAQALAILLPEVSAHDFSRAVTIGPPQAVFNFPPLPDHNEREVLEDWLVAAMFQELSRGLRQSLEEAYIYAQAMALHGQIVRPTVIEDIRADAARLHTPQLLEQVNGLLKDPLAFFAEIEALNAARNCLEHGRGVVRLRDCQEGQDVLRLAMPYFALCKINENGSTSDIEFGVPLKEATQVGIERRTHVFEFGLGERLALTSQQIEAVAIGCILFAKDLVGKLPAPKKTQQ